MHKLQANVDVGEQELSELRLVLERQIGVLLDTTTEELTQAMSEELGSQLIASAGLLLERLRSSDAECEHLAEHLLDGETRFFRHPLALQSLASQVLPELQKRKPEHPRSLRILSAGCSTGEEPYSIGMSVCEVVNCNGGGWNVNIVACDIRRRALEIGGARPLSPICPGTASGSPGTTLLCKSGHALAGEAPLAQSGQVFPHEPGQAVLPGTI